MTDMLGNSVEWMGDKIGQGIIYALTKIGKGIGGVLIQGEALFTLAAIIGIYLSLAGNKKLGTKVSSISILSYLIVRVMMG